MSQIVIIMLSSKISLKTVGYNSLNSLYISIAKKCRFVWWKEAEPFFPKSVSENNSLPLSINFIVNFELINFESN